jgi:cytochrome P450
MFYHGVHHNPAHWTTPQQFDPERFHPEIVSQRHTFAYLPFSGGPRKCAGDEFALMEMHLAIVMIAQRFSIQLLPDQDFSPKTSITMRPHQGVKARMTQRIPANSPF